MLIYDHNKQLIAIDNDTLQQLGYKSFSDFLNAFDDIAELFVKKPGYIHNFQNFPWIDFVIHADADDTKAIIAAPKRQFSCNLEITPIHMRNAPDEDGYIIHLRHIKLISGEAAPPPKSSKSEPAPAATEPVAPAPVEMIEMDDEPISLSEPQEVAPVPPEEEPLAIDLDMDIDLFEEEQSADTDALLPADDATTKRGPTVSEAEAEYLADLENDDAYKYDPHVAAEELGLPVELIEEFIEDFIQQSHEFKEQLFDANGTEDFDEVHVLSHKLKGVAANLRIEDAFEILKTVNESKDALLIDAYLKQFYRIIARMEGKAPEAIVTGETVPPSETALSMDADEDSLYDIASVLDNGDTEISLSEDDLFSDAAETTAPLSEPDTTASPSEPDLTEKLNLEEADDFFSLQDDNSESFNFDNLESIESESAEPATPEKDEKDEIAPLDLDDDVTLSRNEEDEPFEEFDFETKEDETKEKGVEGVTEETAPPLSLDDEDDDLTFSFDDDTDEAGPTLPESEEERDTEAVAFDDDEDAFALDDLETTDVSSPEETPEETEEAPALAFQDEDDENEFTFDAPITVPETESEAPEAEDISETHIEDTPLSVSEETSPKASELPAFDDASVNDDDEEDAFEMLDLSGLDEEEERETLFADDAEPDTLDDILSNGADDNGANEASSVSETGTDERIYDPKIAARELGLPADMIQELTEDFTRQVYSSKGTLYKADKSDDFETIDDLSHKLRGVAANLRIAPIVSVLKDLNNPYNRDQISENLEQLYRLTDILNAQGSFGVPEKGNALPEEVGDESLSVPEARLPELNYDLAEASKAIGIDPDFAASLINELLKEADTKRSQLASASEENDLTKVKKIYLEFKGLSDNLRISDLSQHLNDALECLEPECITRYNSTLFSLLSQLREIIPIPSEEATEKEAKIAAPLPEVEAEEEQSTFQNVHLEYDRASAAKALGIGDDFIRALLKEYVEDAKAKRADVERALEENNLVKVQAVLLEFKGIADNLRIQQVSDILDWAFECSDAVCLKKIERAFYHLLKQFKF